jgi:alpha-L-rhamnosidase
MLNQLWGNILWGQRGNFLSVPTDCPQRDERLGWLGDAQIFVRAACFNMDAAAFFSKWMEDVVDAQSEGGGFSDVAPRIADLADGAPAWGDAGIIIPWTLYQMYGDIDIIERHYAAMTRWMAYIHQANPHLLRTKRLNNNFGDWVALDGHTSKELLATAYWAQNARLMADMASATGRPQDATSYQELLSGIKHAFNTAYVYEDGRLEGGSQTAYLLALHMDLLPDELRQRAAAHLVAEIGRNNWHLSTGFVGTPCLWPVLVDTGRLDIAYRLLLDETYPSWGYMIKHGATTMWERWNSWTEEGGLHDPGMNSFNHYAYGAIGEWLFRTIAGIDTDPTQPGFHHIHVHPRPGGGLTSAQGSYDSIHGRITTHWRLAEGAFHLDITIPANCTATVTLPTADTATVLEGGRPAVEAAAVTWLDSTGEETRFNIGSGLYQFVAPFASGKQDN